MEDEQKLQLQVDFINLAVGLAKAPHTFEGKSRLDSTFLRKYISVIYEGRPDEMAKFNAPGTNVPRSVLDAEVRIYFVDQIRGLVAEYNLAQGYERAMYREHLLRLRNLKRALIWSLDNNLNFEGGNWRGLAPLNGQPVFDVGSVMSDTRSDVTDW